MELPKVTELKKLIKFCRENGLSELKYGDFEVKLSPASHFPGERTASDDTPSIPKDQLISEEDVLFYSVAGLPPEAAEAGV